MSRFYGTLDDPNSQYNVATKRGFSCIKASAQSYDGSVITRLYYTDNDVLMVRIAISEGSSSVGDTYFEGTLEELKERLKGEN